MSCERRAGENRFDQVSARLLDGQRRQLAVVKRSLGHHAVDGQRKLLRYLVERNLCDRAIAPSRVGKQRVGVLDCALAAFDRNVHRQPRCAATERGNAATAAETRTTSTPRGNIARLAASALESPATAAPKSCASATAGAGAPGRPRCRNPRPAARASPSDRVFGCPARTHRRAAHVRDRRRRRTPPLRVSVRRAPVCSRIQSATAVLASARRATPAFHSPASPAPRAAPALMGEGATAASAPVAPPRPRECVHHRAKCGLACEHRRGESGAVMPINPRLAPA